MSLSDFIKRELQRAVERPTMREWPEATRQAKPIPAKRSSAQIARELRDSRKIVLDASVVVQLPTNGPLADSLSARLGREHRFVHCSSSCWMRRSPALQGISRPAGASIGIGASNSSPGSQRSLRSVMHTPLLGRIWQLRHNLTAYDAAHLALAEMTDSVLYTCEEKLSKGHPCAGCAVRRLNTASQESGYRVPPAREAAGAVVCDPVCMPDQTTTRSTAIPGMLYRNAPDAIEWLCRVFGFEKHAVYPGPGNTILHAELTLGGGMIMLGSVNDKAARRHMKLPAEVGGAQTRGVSLIVKDADEVYARTRAAGAQIVEAIEDKPQGGRGFACLDPEGYLWHVGTYDPWTVK